jgi:selenocysteine lyase/cysteine desulfurase
MPLELCHPGSGGSAFEARRERDPRSSGEALPCTAESLRSGVVLSPSELEGLWNSERPYLNTASYGLPPTPAYDALQQALAEWRHGRTSWEGWTEAVGHARASFARLVGCRADDVSAGATVSELVGLVAASLPDGACVLVPDVEFTSNLFPWLVQEQRGVQVRTAPLERLADEVEAATTLVAVSAVQSSNGDVADLGAIAAAAEASDALVLVDATQACGWLPLDAARFDFVVVHTYKWLMSPRGAALMAVRPERLDALKPIHAGWWAGEEPHKDYYGPPLRLAHSARRLDSSPAWFSWVGTAPTMELVERIGVEAIHEHDVSLANRFRAGMGLEPADTAIVSLDVEDGAAKLDRAGIRAAVRAGGLRVSFHLYNTPADVDAALDALS